MSAEVVQLAVAPTEAVATAPESEPQAARLLLADAPDVMSAKTLSRALDDIAEATLAEWRTKDKGKPVDEMVGPPWRKFGGAVRYLKPDILAWIERSPAGASV